MPTVAEPRIFQVPDVNYEQFGQGAGTLLGALLQYYRQKGPGTYTSPTGEQIPAQAVHGQRTPPLAGYTFTPQRLPFLDAMQPSNVALDRQYKQSQIQENQARAELYRKAGDVRMITLPDGTQIPGIATTSGIKPLTSSKETLTPEKEGQRRGIIAQEQERAKQAANIPSAIRSVKVHLDQFQQAFPSENHSQALQAAIGASKNIGAKLGLGVTPQQQAVLKTLPLATIGLVRVSGALGRVSNQELDAASEALNQAGLTDETRLLTARALAQQYLARVEPKDLERALHDNPDLADTLMSFGVALPVEVPQTATKGFKYLGTTH